MQCCLKSPYFEGPAFNSIHLSSFSLSRPVFKPATLSELLLSHRRSRQLSHSRRRVLHRGRPRPFPLIVPCSSTIARPLVLEPTPPRPPASRVPLTIAPSKRVVRQAAAKKLLAATRPPAPTVRSPPLLATSMLKEPVRSVPTPDLPEVAAIPNVGRRLKPQTKRLRLLPTPPNGPAPSFPTAIMPRPHEVTAGRGPVVPTAVLTARLALSITITRLPPTGADA